MFTRIQSEITPGSTIRSRRVDKLTVFFLLVYYVRRVDSQVADGTAAYDTIKGRSWDSKFTVSKSESKPGGNLISFPSSLGVNSATFSDYSTETDRPTVFLTGETAIVLPPYKPSPRSAPRMFSCLAKISLARFPFSESLELMLFETGH